jgi:Fic family protein
LAAIPSGEKVIEAERKQYYDILKRSQRGRTDITHWLEWFLVCLGRAVDGAESNLASILRKAKLWEQINLEPVNERQRKVINRLLDGFEGKLSTSKYAKLAKCSGEPTGCAWKCRCSSSAE